MTLARLFLAAGAFSAALSVAAGAFGAHGLKSTLAPELLAAFETAARYQMFHALGLIGVAWVAERQPTRWAGAAGWSMIAGTVLFSGSLYALSLTGWRAFGAVTPFGGIAFIAGWISLGLAAVRAAPD